MSDARPDRRGVRVGGRRVRIALVEDHAAVRRAIREALSTQDIEVVDECGTSAEAIERLPALVPDVVLLDLDLPDASGFEVLRELAPRLPTTRIVVLTVSDQRADLYEAITLGAAGYLTKDIRPEALRRAIRAIPDGDLPMPRRMAAEALRHFAAGRAPTRDGAGTGTPSGLLSPRQEEIVQLIGEGLTDREIARRLVLSPRTIESHVAEILRRLGARNRAAAVTMHRGGTKGEGRTGL